MEVKFSQVRNFSEELAKNAGKFADTDVFRTFAYTNIGLYALWASCAILSRYGVI